MNYKHRLPIVGFALGLLVVAGQCDEPARPINQAPQSVTPISMASIRNLALSKVSFSAETAEDAVRQLKMQINHDYPFVGELSVQVSDGSSPNPIRINFSNTTIEEAFYNIAALLGCFLDTSQNRWIVYPATTVHGDIEIRKYALSSVFTTEFGIKKNDSEDTIENQIRRQKIHLRLTVLDWKLGIVELKGTRLEHSLLDARLILRDRG